MIRATILLLAAQMVLGCPVAGAALPGLHELDKRFLSRTHTYTGGRYRDHVFNYRLLVPDDMSDGAVYPLIIWLHGWGDGEIGLNEPQEVALGPNVTQLRHTEHLMPDGISAPVSFFVLTLQCQKDQPYWTSGIGDPSNRFEDEKGDEPLTVAMEVADEIIELYPIDEDRVSIVGISSGGSGAWECAMRYPHRFSAVALLATGGADESRAHRMVRIPTWAFHSDNDPSTPINGVARMVGALRDVGGIVHLTRVDSDVHDCWTAAFQNYELVSWLLSQVRGEKEHISIRNRVRRMTRHPTWSAITGVATATLVGILICIVIRWRGRQKSYSLHRPPS